MYWVTVHDLIPVETEVQITFRYTPNESASYFKTNTYKDVSDLDCLIGFTKALRFCPIL